MKGSGMTGLSLKFYHGKSLGLISFLATFAFSACISRNSANSPDKDLDSQNKSSGLVAGWNPGTDLQSWTYFNWGQTIKGNKGRNPFFELGKFDQLESLNCLALETISDANAAFFADYKNKGLLEEAAKNLLKACVKGKINAWVIKSLEKLTEEQKDLAAVEYLLTGLTTKEGHDVRYLALNSLGTAKLADMYTIEVLAPLTRGVFITEDKVNSKKPAASMVPQANEMITLISKKMGKSFFTQRPAVNHAAKTEVEQIVAAIQNPKTKLLEVKSTGELSGINSSKIVKFEVTQGGSSKTIKFIFKNLSGTKIMQDKYYDYNPADFLLFLSSTREARAANFLGPIIDRYAQNTQNAGTAPQHAEIVMPITLEGVLIDNDGVSYGIGSFQLFLDGFEDIDRVQSSSRWSAIKNSIQWAKGAAAVRLLDYNFGNGDRLSMTGIREYQSDRNLMFKLDGKQLVSLGLIDNGVGLPGKPNFQPNRILAACDIPKELRDSYKYAESHKDELIAELKEESYYIPKIGIENFYWQVGNIINRVKQDSGCK
jgi:hypothetical protein